MKTKPDNVHDYPPLGDLAHLARLLPKPMTYYDGRTPPAPVVLPSNILCFHRNGMQLMQRRRPGMGDQHHRFVFICALKGSGRVCVDAESFLLQEGHAGLIFPFQFHSYLSVQPEAQWVFVTFEMTNGNELEKLRSATVGTDETEILLLREIVENWVASGSAGTLQLYLAALLGRLVAKDIPAAGKRRQKRMDQPDSELLLRVNARIMENPGRHFTAKELASLLGQSESHLRKRFREATGLALGRHLRDMRLRRACSLLHNSRNSIQEIAAQCGFDSVYSFSRAFKNAWRHSPRAYRKRNLNTA